jgi:hypothetical protein
LFVVLLEAGADPSIQCLNEFWGDWPACWFYADADSSLGVESAERMEAQLEQRCPTPYWEPYEVELAREIVQESGGETLLEGFLNPINDAEYRFLNRPGIRRAADAAIEYGRAINLLDLEYLQHRLTEEVTLEDAGQSVHLKCADSMAVYVKGQIQGLAAIERTKRISVQLGTDSKGQVVALLHRWREPEPFSWVEIEADFWGKIAELRTVYNRSMLKFIVKSGVDRLCLSSSRGRYQIVTRNRMTAPWRVDRWTKKSFTCSFGRCCNKSLVPLFFSWQ